MKIYKEKIIVILTLSILTIILSSACDLGGGGGGDEQAVDLTDPDRISAAPVISPESGEHYLISGNQLLITLDVSVPGADIFYTTDGLEPTKDSTPYTAPFPISGSSMVRSIAYEAGKEASAVTEAVFTIMAASGTAEAPVISPSGSELNNPAEITMSSATPGASIYYTTDGSAPSALSTPYTGPFTIDAPVEKVRAVAVKTGEERSYALENYSFVASGPTVTRKSQWDGGHTSMNYIVTDGGVFSAGYYEEPDRGTKLIATTATAGGEIRYTIDGSTPSESSILHTGQPVVWWERADTSAPYYLYIAGEKVTASVTLSTGMKIRVFREGYLPSPVFTMGFSKEAPIPRPD